MSTRMSARTVNLSNAIGTTPLYGMPTGMWLVWISLVDDITSRKVAEDEIRNLAFYDHLTGLPNRRLLIDRVRQAMASSSRSAQHCALLFLDLDNFKILNDTLGHDIGDLLLQQVASRVSNCVRKGDTVARLGGDEFVVMLEELSEFMQEAVMQTEAVGSKDSGRVHPALPA